MSKSGLKQHGSLSRSCFDPVGIVSADLTFAHQAAKRSWHSIVVVFVLGVFAKPARAELAFETLSFFVLVLGLALGIAALFGIRKHGRKGILAPAAIGIVLNALLLFIFITNFLAARAKALEELNR